MPLCPPTKEKKLFKTEHFKALLAKTKALSEPNVQQSLAWSINYLKHLQTPITPEILQIIEHVIHTTSSYVMPPLTPTQTTIFESWIMQLNDAEKESLISMGHPLSDLITPKAIINQSLFKPNVTQKPQMEPLSRTS